MAPDRPLLLQASFARVWWAGLISWVGNGALFIALPVQVYGETGSALATALVLMAGAVPPVIVGQFAGVLVDRLDYRRVLVWANVGMAVVTLGFLPAAHAPWPLMALVGFLASSIGQFLGPAENALLPTLLGRERLGEANSLNALNNNLARLIGPALGGLVLARLGFPAVILLDVLTFVVAALLLAGVVGEPVERVPRPERVAFLREWREGLAVVTHNSTLRVIFIVVAVVAFGEGFISTLMAPFVRDILGGDGQALGLIMSAQALGGAAGAWVVARVADRWSALRLLALGALGSGLLRVLMFNYALVYREVWPAVALTAVAGLPFAIFGTAQGLGLQRATPQKALGRVFSASYGLMGLTMLLGMGVSGVLGDRVGALVINVDAATYLLAGLIAWRAVRGRDSGRGHEVAG
ncbi:MFS transporter [Deinococcus apachensis]|uniref:MFS transporter n=1 Tax=Deinococcus apachensis TaxID=309886 RepID=UPI0003735156|nr:MFS transporter [Deinococcus apachensis]